MAYLGRFQQGDVVPLMVACHDVNNTPTMPDAPPVLDLRSPGAQVRTVTMPILDRYQLTGLYSYPLRIDSAFTPGVYTATYGYNVGSYTGQEQDTWEVVAGGNPAGCVVALTNFERPTGTYLVEQTESNVLRFGRNPSF